VSARSWGSDPAQLSHFDSGRHWAIGPPPARWSEQELLCFDLETTGVDRFSDLPVSMAFVRFRDGLPVERIVRIVDPGRSVPIEATEVHGISTVRVRREGIVLAAAAELLVGILVAASRRGIPVVGVKLDYDLTIVDLLSRAFDGRGLVERGWTGPVLDALVLDRQLDPGREGRRTLVDLCECYGVTIDRAHSADCDAEAAGGVLLQMARRYPELADSTLPALHLAQEGFHRAWAASYDEWRRARGLEPLDPSEGSWPVAAPPAAEEGAA